MSKNREPVKPVESQLESEDEELSSEESDSESEQPQMAVQPQPAVKPPPPPSSSEEEESETESDSDEPDSNARPLASKPIEKAQKSTVARSKPSSPEPITPTKSAAAKRPSEDAVSKDAKKAKKIADPETSEKKPNLFQRLFSEEDEIAILQGMIDYAAKNKSDPLSDLNAFHDFIKNSLHLDFSRTQLQEKIRRLKKKYGNNKSKEEEGKERTFSKSHDQSVYDLSKEIWGKEIGKEKVVGSLKTNGSMAKKTPSKNASGEGDKSLQNLNYNYIGGGVEEMMFQSGRKIYELGEGVEEEWKKLKVEELELYLKQLEVKVAQTKLVLNGLKAGDH